MKLVHTSAALVHTSTALVHTSAALVLTSTALVHTSTALMLTSAALVLTSTALVLTSTALALTSAALVLTSAAPVLTSAAPVLTSTPQVPTSTPQVLTVTAPVLTSTARLVTATTPVVTSDPPESNIAPVLHTAVGPLRQPTVSARLDVVPRSGKPRGMLPEDPFLADDEHAYSVAPDPSGGDPTVTDEDGNIVLINADAQSFCNFLTWVSRRHVAPFTDVQKGVYVTTDAAWEELARSAGHMFEVDLTTGVPQLRGAAGIVWKGLPAFRFFALYRCVAIPDGTGQTAPNGIHGEPGPLYVSANLFERLNLQLTDESSTARCVSSWTVDRAFVYVDVSDFSKYLPGQQALVINSLVSLVAEAQYWNGPGGRTATDARNGREAELCIGDGYIFVFRSAVEATVFAAYLAALIESLLAREALPVEFHFRIGVHFGPVFRFWDNGRHGWNYTGSGINGGQRVLGAVGKDADDIVFVSSAVRKRILAEPVASAVHTQLRAEMQNRGRRADKHGNPWRVYELNHTAIATMLLPVHLRGGFAAS